MNNAILYLLVVFLMAAAFLAAVGTLVTAWLAYITFSKKDN